MAKFGANMRNNL